MVVGGGIVGMLAAGLASRLPGAKVTLVDIEPSRETIANKLGIRFALPDQAPGDADLVIHSTHPRAVFRSHSSLRGSKERLSKQAGSEPAW